MNTPLLSSSFALCASVLIAQAPMPRCRTVEDVLPTSTYAVVQFGGVAACRAAADELPMASLVARLADAVPAEVRAQHVEAGLARAAEHVRRALTRAGVTSGDLHALLGRPMALAMGRASIEGMGPSVALVVDVGDAAAAIGRCANALAALVARDEVPATVDLGGVTLRHLASTGGAPLFFGEIDGWFVATNSRGYARDLAGVVRGGQPSLAATGRPAHVVPAGNEAPLASLFVNTAPFAAMFDAHLPYEAVDLADAAGIGRLDGVYAATSITPTGAEDVLHIGLRGSEKGAAKVLLAGPVDLGFAELCSANTVAFAAGSVDVLACADAVRRCVALLPAPVRGPLHEALLANLRGGLGVAPKHAAAALQAFGAHVAIAVALEKGAVPKPELLLCLEVRERAAVADLLQRLEARTARQDGLAWKSRQVGTHEIRFCNVELPNGRLQLSPSYALLDGQLVCASDVAALVRALRQREDGAGSLAAQPDFQAMAGAVASQCGVLHLRLFRAAQLGWRTVETWAYPQLDAHADEIGFGSDVLPDADAVAAALGTATVSYRVAEDGIEVHNRGALALGQLVIAAGAVLDDVLRRGGAKIY